jgi:hypothetical protein
MREVLQQACIVGESDGVPVGAVEVHNGQAMPNGIANDSQRTIQICTWENSHCVTQQKTLAPGGCQRTHWL